MRWKRDAWREHGLVFPTSSGRPSDPDNFSHVFSRLTKSVGLGHWHPHELRHSGARPGDPVARGLRSPRSRQRRDHQRRLRASHGG
ncbi:tyrosine-type recombinase/integrase [Microbispora rosea]|uniref:tyrosine-type recombinase/integrase n=1 Tax=Microbispora rosea TaxID=58117 RepID=UPI0039C600EE